MFFRKMGFEFNQDYCDDKGCCLVLADHIYAMLLVEDFFAGFTKAGITDTAKDNEVILSIAVDSPETMEDMMEAGLEAGGKDRTSPFLPEEEGMMQYYRLEDLDGHLWEITYMNTTESLPNPAPTNKNKPGCLTSSPVYCFQFIFVRVDWHLAHSSHPTALWIDCQKAEDLFPV